MAARDSAAQVGVPLARSSSIRDSLTGRASWFSFGFAVLCAVIVYVLARHADLESGGAVFLWLIIVAPASVMFFRLAEFGAVLSEAAERRHAHEESTQEVSLAPVLDGLPLPLLLFGANRRISFMNRAAQTITGVDASGRDIAVAIRNPDVLAAVDGVIAGGPRADVDFTQVRLDSLSLRVRIEALPTGEAGPSFVAYIDDVTDDLRLREVRTDFVADVSHELRTPLASILSIVETLNGPASADAAARLRFMAMLEEQASRMARIVEDLLSLSQLEMTEHQPPVDPVDLQAVLDDVLPASRVLAQPRNMAIKLLIDRQVIVVGDHLQLVRMFQNLIDNAVKYGSEGTVVVVTVSRDAEKARIAVQDQGAGIAREDIPRLTERFYRVDKGRSRAAGGTGLGLAIVKHVVNRHRGNLRVESTVGEGSCFTVELPLVKD